jgi:hypothetical protein
VSGAGLLRGARATATAYLREPVAPEEAPAEAELPGEEPAYSEAA